MDRQSLQSAWLQSNRDNISVWVWHIPLLTAVRHTLALGCWAFHLFVHILFQHLEPRLRDTSAISLYPATCTMFSSHILITHCLCPCPLHSFWSEMAWTLLTWQPPFGIIPLMVVIDSVSFVFSHITGEKNSPRNTILYAALRGWMQEDEKFKAIFGHIESSSLVLDLWPCGFLFNLGSDFTLLVFESHAALTAFQPYIHSTAVSTHIIRFLGGIYY